jgi:hypothetical protein
VAAEELVWVVPAAVALDVAFHHRQEVHPVLRAPQAARQLDSRSIWYLCLLHPFWQQTIHCEKHLSQ